MGKESLLLVTMSVFCRRHSHLVLEDAREVACAFDATLNKDFGDGELGRDKQRTCPLYSAFANIEGGVHTSHGIDLAIEMPWTETKISSKRL